MPRLAPKIEVVRALFARSGNQCAFPGCTAPLLNRKNQFIAQICHIEAALPGGPRYNDSQTDEQKRSYDNLLIMCHPHHVETHDIEEFSVERLREIKIDHEVLFQKFNFKIDESGLFNLVNEMEKYWTKIDRLNTIEHLFEELSFRIDGKSTAFEVLASARDTITYIKELLVGLRESDDKLPHDFKSLLEKKGIPPELFDDIPYYEHPFVNRNWEYHNLGAPNGLQRLEIDLVHIEVKYLEEFLKTNSGDSIARGRLEQVKKSLADLAKNAIHVD